jgi:hypothetical protein
MADQAETRSQNAAQITERAAKDPVFRQELLADPKGVLARELGVALPDFLQVQELEETPTSVYLVLPVAQLSAGVELSDEQLEAAAGGWSSTGCYSCADHTAGCCPHM